VKNLAAVVLAALTLVTTAVALAAISPTLAQPVY
jgi:hypothetical protein